MRVGLTIACLLVTGALHAGPILQTDAFTNELNGAIGVQVAGDLLNVRFVDGTCINLFGGCDENADFFFAGAEGRANQASMALASQVLLGVDSASINGCGDNRNDTCDLLTTWAGPTMFSNPLSSIARAFGNSARFVGNTAVGPSVDLGDSPFSTYAIWSGTQTGEHPDLPILPPVDSVVGFTFEFDALAGQTIYIDPEIAIGYDYVLGDINSPLYSSVTAPIGFGDGLFDLFLWDGSDFVFDSVIQGGIEHTLGLGGVDRFRLLGIDESAAVDPTDPLGFVTGVSFLTSGAVRMTQSPITINTDDPTPVSEPGTLGLFCIGLIGLGLARRRKAAYMR